jgi:hypothetical protein
LTPALRRGAVLFFTVVGEGDAIHRAAVDAGVALMQRAGEHSSDVVRSAALLKASFVEAQLDLGHDVLQRLLLGAVGPQGWSMVGALSSPLVDAHLLADEVLTPAPGALVLA